MKCILGFYMAVFNCGIVSRPAYDAAVVAIKQ